MDTIKTTVHSFLMGDVEDPYLYAAEPIYKWQQTDMGKWAMENIKDLTFNCIPDQNTMGYRVVIRGEMNDRDYTYFRLKWGDNVKSK